MVKTEKISNPNSSETMWKVTSDGVYVGFITKFRDTRATINPYKVFLPAVKDSAAPAALVSFVYPIKPGTRLYGSEAAFRDSIASSNARPGYAPTTIGELQDAAKMLVA